MRIGIDIDNVIAETVPVVLPEINHTFGSTLKCKDVYMYDFHAILGISEFDMENKFWKKRKLIEKLFMQAKPVRGAQNAINKLSKNNEIILVTDRPQEYMNITKKWLDKWHMPYNEIRHMVSGIRGKHTYAEFRKNHGFGFDVFIDDKLEEVILIAEYCPLVFLYKRPWNATKNINNSFICVNNWEEIIRKIVLGA
jgi:uncharacterized HAD superfamily protein